MAQQKLTPAVDGLDSSISRGGSLLVVSHLFVIPILVSWVGLEKKQTNLNLEVKNIFARSHSEHHCWICPYKQAPKIVALLHVAGAPHFSPLSFLPSLSLTLCVS